MKHITRNILIGVAVLAIAGAGVWAMYSKGAPSVQKQNTVHPVTAIRDERYIITSGFSYNSSTRAERSWLSIYQTDGTFVKRINLDNTHMIGKMVIAGSDVYFQTGSRREAVVAVLSLQTGVMKLLTFTRTMNSNIGNSLVPMIDYAVSKDERMIAWQDTSGNMFVSAMDGSNKRTIATSSSVSFGAGFIFSDDARSLTYTDSSQYVMRTKVFSLESGTSQDATSTTPSRETVTSPSGRYIATVDDSHDSSKEGLTIRDTVASTTVHLPYNANDLGQPDPNAMFDYGPFVIGFSSDESNVLFGFGTASYGLAGTYLVDTNGTHFRTLYTDAEPIVRISDSSMIIMKYDKALYLSDFDGHVTKKLTDDDAFFGVFTMPALTAVQADVPITGETSLRMVGAPQPLTLDVTKWKDYREENLGFDIKIPPEWANDRISEGAGGGDELGLTKYQIGEATWTNEDIRFTLIPRKTDLPLQNLNSELRFDYGKNNVQINGLPALRNTSDFHFAGSAYQYHDAILIKKGDRAYTFEIDMMADDEGQAAKMKQAWDQVIASFQPISQQNAQ